MKNKIEGLHGSLAKFTDGTKSLNTILGNKRGNFKKTSLGHRPKTHEKTALTNVCLIKTSNHTFFEYFYSRRNDHTFSIYNIRNNHEIS